MRLSDLSPGTLLVLGVSLVVMLALGSIPSVQLSLVDLLEESESVLGVRSTSTSEGVEEAKVSRVSDGDTLVLEDGRRLRYLNVDTPETVKPGTPVQCFGPQASDFNKRLVEGKVVYLTKDKEDTDRYGRYLRFVFLPGKDTSDVSQSVNAEMVDRGLARVSIYKPNTTYQDVFLSLERQAKDDKRGLWGACET